MTSKDQERKALQQIKEIVNGLGSDSYLAAAFSGCFEDAEEDIENDFALCWKDRAESAGRRIEELEARERELMAQLEAADKAIQSKAEEVEEHLERGTSLILERNEARRIAENLQAELVEERRNREYTEALKRVQDQEILKLKARLYDAIVEGKGE